MAFWYGQDVTALAEMPVSVQQRLYERLPYRRFELFALLVDALSVPYANAEIRTAIFKRWSPDGVLEEQKPSEQVWRSGLSLLGVAVVKAG